RYSRRDRGLGRETVRLVHIEADRTGLSKHTSSRIRNDDESRQLHKTTSVRKANTSAHRQKSTKNKSAGSYSWQAIAGDEYDPDAYDLRQEQMRSRYNPIPAPAPAAVGLYTDRMDGNQDMEKAGLDNVE